MLKKNRNSHKIVRFTNSWVHLEITQMPKKYQVIQQDKAVNG